MAEIDFEKKNNNRKATASMILGFIALIDLLFPIFALPFDIVGLILGILGLKSIHKKKAKVGIIMNIIGMVLCIAVTIMTIIIYVNYKSKH
ncbi:hypothetical protein [Clostridium sp.]|uniref:hypothetical protein n=1 Tax=Clostridium sp. TaxID=1506 RepID=UPI0026397B51|nr:hypothetical protein [Clostridium sp.]